ncbi:DUF4142 domain-containing protein [Rhodoplanes sp. SY1]|uniref:DUF4142 domain-containing protein n=1 Tax=Rhodoplanes sp. SY1 TaxID=3166646 RepID=UPI0038B6AA57
MTDLSQARPRPTRDYNIYVLFVAGLAFVLFALWSRGPGVGDMPTAASVGAVLGTASQRAEASSGAATAPIPTAEFVQKAAIGNLFEIETSRIARAKTNPGELDFADQMILAHLKTADELRGLRESAKIDATLPTDLDAAHRAKVDQLRALDGAAFRDAYIKMQRDAHRDAVALFQAYARSGDNPELKQWADTTLPALKHHLDMAQALN